jgi:hypothetical protein
MFYEYEFKAVISSQLDGKCQSADKRVFVICGFTGYFTDGINYTSIYGDMGLITFIWFHVIMFEIKKSFCGFKVLNSVWTLKSVNSTKLLTISSHASTYVAVYMTCLLVIL